MALMPPAIPPSVGGSVIDPTWINAASGVIGKALQPGNVGPSRSETGGIFSQANPFIVSTGSGDAAGAPSTVSSIVTVAVVVIIGVIAWKQLKKS